MTRTKTNLTVEDIAKAMSELTKKFEADTTRHFTMITGEAGMDMFSRALERQNNKDFADFLLEKNLITVAERDSLHAMIDSPDAENYEVAKVILQTKSETNSNFKSCQLYSKPPITNTKALIQTRELNGLASQVLLVSSNKNLTP